MVWGPVYQLLLAPVSSTAQTVSAIQSGVTLWFISHMSLPFHRIQIWDGKCFLKHLFLEQGFVMHLGHMGNPAQSRGIPG